MIDIFNIQPHVVSKDLTGKSFLIYGDRKVGKTTCACSFPKAILLGFEKGWDYLDGVLPVPINSWKEALDVKKQLLKDVKAVADGEKSETVYKTVIVDTIDIAYDLCEKFILDKEGVEYLDETEKMRGYRAVSREYDKFFQEIMKAGYTLVCISHATTKQVKENGEKYDKTIPTVPDRGFLVVSRLVDVCAYATFEPNPDDPNNPNRVLIMRGSKNLEAGSRNKYMSTKIPFTYEALREDMEQAVEKLKAEGGKVTESANNLYKDQSEKIDFKATMAEIRKIAKALNNLDLMNDYTKIVNEYLGKGRSVKDCDESQSDMLALILEDLKDYVKENNIEV